MDQDYSATNYASWNGTNLESTIKDYGLRERYMARKDKMKRFREHVSKYRPAKGIQHWGAYAAGNDSFLAVGGASTSRTDRDASHVLKRIIYSYYKGESGKTLVNNGILVNRPDPSSPRQRIQRQLEVQTTLHVSNAMA